MLNRFWYRQAMVCFALWVAGLVALAIIHPAKGVTVGFVSVGLFLCVVSLAVGVWMTRCPHCKWRLWVAVSRGLYDPGGVFICPRCGKPIKLK